MDRDTVIALPIEDWFATPIAYGYLPFEIDPAVVNYCLSTKENDKDFVQNWDSNTYNTFTRREHVDAPVFDQIKAFLIDQVRAYAAALGCMEPFSVTPLQGWFNVAEKGNHQEAHIHVNSHISAVVYLQATEDCGDIIFFDRYFDSAPLPKMINSKYNSPRVHYKPSSKKFLIFRSNTPHMVAQNKTDSQRISMSFNYWVA